MLLACCLFGWLFGCVFVYLVDCAFVCVFAWLCVLVLCRLRVCLRAWCVVVL